MKEKEWKGVAAATYALAHEAVIVCELQASGALKLDPASHVLGNTS